jgi:CopG family nickel-responsive transcriptional regulator
MEKITRKGISFNKKELQKFDELIKKKGYKTRSSAIRNLIRKELIQEEQKNPEKIMTATLTIVYNHDKPGLQHDLTHVQHHHSHLIKSSIHVHIDEKNCLEVLILKGKVKHIKNFSDKIISRKGVKFGKLVVAD